ncbi:M-phase phosphoprotein 6 [Oopsacas minuta]|uniref:M-phase phosphoprotein 6 n=1 Tax=Oopsacas minuta TaxID=111878 RepID=A0AAV7JLD5_9METZ|nr:M-phase phosphoprotein 6 [Oopsacas minuta]
MTSYLKKGTKVKGPKQLSRTVMAMKFMKRRIVNEEQSDENKIAPVDAWYALAPPDTKKPRKPPETLSYAGCMDLLENGHLSFGNFNVNVEKEMEAMKRGDTGELSESDKSVSDNEMADRYDNLIGTIGKKVKRKQGYHIDFIDTESNIPKKKRKIKKKFNNQQK